MEKVSAKMQCKHEVELGMMPEDPGGEGGGEEVEAEDGTKSAGACPRKKEKQILLM